MMHYKPSEIDRILGMERSLLERPRRIDVLCRNFLIIIILSSFVPKKFYENPLVVFNSVSRRGVTFLSERTAGWNHRA